MTAIILLILGIRLTVLRPAIEQALIAAPHWRAHRQRCAKSLARLCRCAPWLRCTRCIRCLRGNSESDDFLVCP